MTCNKWVQMLAPFPSPLRRKLITNFLLSRPAEAREILSMLV